MIRITDGGALNHRIRELAVDDPDPGVITEKILSEIDYVEARVIVEITLREHVRRTTATPAPLTTPPTSYITSAGESTPSARTAARRDWIAAELAVGLCVGPDTYRHLGDCRVPDLRYVATTRYTKAEQARLAGAKYDRIADLLIEHQVETVAQLPRDVLADILKH